MPRSNDTVTREDALSALPLPIAGVLLAMASLGNLLADSVPWVQPVCLAVALLLLILIALKLALRREVVAQDLGNPIFAGAFITLPMAIMVLATYPAPFAWTVAFAVWCAGLALHLGLAVHYTLRFVAHFKLPQVTPVYYIAYVGYAIAAVTAPTFHMQALGSILTACAAVLFIPCTVVIVWRYIKHPAPEPAKPLTCIFAAPFALLLVGYLNCASAPNTTLVVLLALGSYILYLFGLIKLVGYLRLPFYPSYTAFTFPFVISAMSTKALIAFLGTSTPAVLTAVLAVQEAIAVALVVYVLARYLIAIFGRA